ncbi:NAD-dependent epimerase/dehydratase family protein [Adhaeribacter radiodurans]|uniref:ATP-grasp domain-containing protein n=1 Tax=Adhaeribacter radiodurans TaxID=2745197 RepID=A0A7L7L804_9BACT|nr:NAD-dependent epimerase/dehydratase family protein [Adhaeribacter radiodurans]QMU28981.1 ATP-grasp domain-containing protein [Adhaeribacter radiodurans]
MYKGKKVFISGGNGVIGNELVQKLHEAGAILLIGDLKDRPTHWPSDIQYRKGDLNYITAAELQTFAPEYFFHLAATFERSKETYGFWEENYQHNVNLSHHLMTEIKDLPSIKKVIFASSYLIYDPILYNFQEPAAAPYSLKETDPILPRNLTGSAKLNHEIELRFLEDFRGEQFQTICVRIYRSYGKNSRDIISRWVRALLNQESLTVFKKEGIFDYIYAGDVAEGLMRLGPTAFKGIINLGSGKARKVAEMIDVLKQHFPALTYQEENSDILYEASQADMTLFQKVTGWLPARKLEDTIPEIISYEQDALTKQLATSSTGNVLVTSIARKVPMLEAIKSAVKKFDPDILLYGADVSSEIIGKHFVDRFWQMPRITDLSVEELLHYCQQENITLIIPSRDGELVFWAAHKDSLAANGISVMLSSLSAVQVCLDKLQFYQTLNAKNLPLIPTVEAIEDLEDTERYVVKERYGAGALNMGLNLSKQDASTHAQKLQHPIFQPFIAGQEYSLDMYVTQQGKVKGIIARTRDLVINGESQITQTVSFPALEKLGQELATAISLSGHVVVQVLVSPDGQFHVIECNSRFGGASTLSVQCGLDSFYWALLEAQGEDLDVYPFARTSEKKQIRFAQDLVV